MQKRTGETAAVIPKHEPLIAFDSATFVRADGSAAFRNFTWRIHEGETWAVLGPTGSGKTSLSECLRGRYRLESGSVAWPIVERIRASGRAIARPAEVIHALSFKEESRLFSYGRHYYQQRFNFIEKEDDLTLDAFLRSGVSATDESIERIASQLGLAGLLPLSLIKLSNGQTRRARIAKVMLAQPELVILDEPFMGLDGTGRSEVTGIIGDLIERGTRIVLIARPDTIPQWVTHVLELKPDGSVVTQTRSEFLDRPTSDGAATIAPPPPAPRKDAAPIIELRNVDVAYDGKPILRNITWTVRTGERWAILGPNGSGKTTLLSLLCGDHPQAYRNDIRLFGRQRGSGESIWDVKRRIGLLSPELHLYFTEPLFVAKTIATGFHDVLAARSITPEQEFALRNLLEAFGIGSWAEQPFARLSTGQQRLVLLLRALVKEPPLLILDEPFQGMDSTMIARARHWLDHRLRPDQTLLFVSHYEAEIPATVNKRLRLHAGIMEVDGGVDPTMS